MNNKPTLFVSSVSKNEIGKENQCIFDSRKKHKSIIEHRLDDIFSLMYLNRRVFVMISFEGKQYLGEIYSFERQYIHLKTDESIISFRIDNISEIKIINNI